MNPRYSLVATRAGHRCEYCRAPELVFNFPFEIEHITPLAHNGADEEFNWALACRSCNLRKGTHSGGIDPDEDVEVRLYHPRQDEWAEHFQVNTEVSEIQGRTPVGRATIERLRMNSGAQVNARREWMRLGLYP